MLYGTAHDELTQDAPAHLPGNRLSGALPILPALSLLSTLRRFKAKPSQYTPTGYRLSGLAVAVNTDPLNKDAIVTQFIGGMIGSNQMVASKSISGNTAYVTLRNTTDGSSTAVIVSLVPLLGAKNAVVGYTPQVVSSVFTPSTSGAGGAALNVTSPEPPVPLPPAPVWAFAPLDPGFSYVLLDGETKYDAPGGNTSLFTASADSVGQNVPYVTPLAPLLGVPAIIVGTTTSAIAIPPTQQTDRWEYKKEHVQGPDNDHIYLHVQLRNLSTLGPVIDAYYSVDSGSGQMLGIDAGKWITALEDTAVALTVAGAVNLAVGGVTGAAVAADASAKGKTVAETAQESAVSTAVVSAAGMLAGGVELLAAAPAAATTAGVTEASAAGAGTTGASGAGTTGLLATTGGVLTKAAGSTILSTGLTALSTEIKKLAGQGPVVPAQAPAVSLMAGNTVPPAPASSLSGTTLLALGVGALALLKKMRG